MDVDKKFLGDPEKRERWEKAMSDTETFKKWERLSELRWEYVIKYGPDILFLDFFDMESVDLLDEKIKAFEHCLATDTIELPIEILENYPNAEIWD